jgi:hypothetical protein
MGIGVEKNGQHYPLFIDDQIHDQVDTLRQQSYDEISAAEYAMQFGGLTSAAHAAEVARHDYHRQRVIKLTTYCINNGLLDRELAA